MSRQETILRNLAEQEKFTVTSREWFIEMRSHLFDHDKGFTHEASGQCQIRISYRQEVNIYENIRTQDFFKGQNIWLIHFQTFGVSDFFQTFSKDALLIFWTFYSPKNEISVFNIDNNKSFLNTKSTYIRMTAEYSTLQSQE